LIVGKNGLILTREVEEAGIPRHYLTLFVRENELERISPGVYLAPDSFDDEMYCQWPFENPHFWPRKLPM
jgi:hypothetical protein